MLIAPSAGSPIVAAKSRWNSSSKGEAPLEGVLRSLALCHQLGERRQIAVAFDQRRPCANSRDEIFVEAPDVITDRRVMAVDQQRAFLVQAVPGEVDLP